MQPIRRSPPWRDVPGKQVRVTRGALSRTDPRAGFSETEPSPKGNWWRECRRRRTVFARLRPRAAEATRTPSVNRNPASPLSCLLTALEQASRSVPSGSRKWMPTAKAAGIPKASWTRSGTGYPLSGCSPAEPDSVSPGAIHNSPLTERKQVERRGEFRHSWNAPLCLENAPSTALEPLKCRKTPENRGRRGKKKNEGIRNDNAQANRKS